jgi:hypothetical protein
MNRIFALTCVLMFGLTSAVAQTFTTNTGGNWAAGGTWVGGTAPANWQNYSAIINGNVQINVGTIAGFTSITLNGGNSFNRGTTGATTNLTLQSLAFTVNNGNITVYGNLTLNAASLTINSGNLDVRGTLTLTNGGSLTFNSGGTISANSFTTGGSGGTLSLNSGIMTVNSDFDINSGGTVSIDSDATLEVDDDMTISNSSSAILNNYGTLTIGDDLTQGGVLNNYSTGSLSVGDDFDATSSSSSISSNYGEINIGDDLSLPGSSVFTTYAGGSSVVEDDVTVYSNQNLVIGTGTAGPPYADMVIKHDLLSENSGDILVNSNGRLAVGNDLEGDGGGIVITIANGGQAYIHDDLILAGGGGNQIVNNNTTNPWGLYVNDNVSNSGGGSTTTGNLGDENTMQTTNPDFYAWVQQELFGVLPIVLHYFEVEKTMDGQVRIFWATQEEEGFDHFEIQRAGSDFEFTTILSKPGAGYNTNTLQQYEAFDALPMAGENYYRIKAVDIDGSIEYFDAKAVVIELPKELTVFPNPLVGRTLSLQLNFQPNEGDRIALFDVTGTEIYSALVTDFKSEWTLSDSIRPGTYVLKYQSESFSMMKRVVVTQ